MDRIHIEDLLRDLELNAEPAFAELSFEIDNLPFVNGILLGAYFPKFHLIVLPPWSEEKVLIHELGHAWAYYNWEDLSEEAAEGFRKAFQGGGSFGKTKVIAGVVSDILGLDED